jgi:hypothetical protein
MSAPQKSFIIPDIKSKIVPIGAETYNFESKNKSSKSTLTTISEDKESTFTSNTSSKPPFKKQSGSYDLFNK